jgi:hypothetical protein
MGQMWGSLTKEERGTWDAKASEDKDRYRKELEVYEKCSPFMPNSAPSAEAVVTALVSTSETSQAAVAPTTNAAASSSDKSGDSDDSSDSGDEV